MQPLERFPSFSLLFCKRLTLAQQIHCFDNGRRRIKSLFSKLALDTFYIRAGLRTCRDQHYYSDYPCFHRSV
jgi:hypothetical protein